MRHAQRVRVWLASLGTSALLLAPGLNLNAQSVSEDQVKAAYMYNFAKFVEWPPGDFASTTAPFRFCVLDDRSFQSELIQVVKGKAIAGRPVIVVPVQNTDDFGNCHILFVGSSKADQLPHIIATLRNRSVLSVGETEGFVDEGGIISFVLQDNRVRFQVNHKAAKQAGLEISSRLLAVAKVVIE